MEIFDITLLRWVNLLLVGGAISYIYKLSKKAKELYLSVPLLMWLLQVFVFYLAYFLYFYGVIDLTNTQAEVLFSYWASISRFMLLVTLWIYLYYLQNSCRRGNGKL